MKTQSVHTSTSSSETSPKDARIELRSTQSQKQMIERAASLMGESVTSYVLSAVLGDAMKVIREHNVTSLSLSDWTRFNAIVTADSNPNATLSEALNSYRERILRSDGA